VRTCDSWIDRIRVTSRLLRLLTSGDAVNVVTGNSTLTGCPYLFPVSAMTTQRLLTSLLRLRPSAAHRYLIGSDLSRLYSLIPMAYVPEIGAESPYRKTGTINRQENRSSCSLAETNTRQSRYKIARQTRQKPVPVF